MIFDLLWLDGHSLMELPYEERRERLARPGAERPDAGRRPRTTSATAPSCSRPRARRGSRGSSPSGSTRTYVPGRRSHGWVKVKNVRRHDVVIGGWLPGEGGRSGRLGALLVGVYDENGELRYAGRVGTGFTEAELDRLGGPAEPLERATRRSRPARRRRGAPSSSSRGWWPRSSTPSGPRAGSLRHPSYKGLRDDKPPEQVVREDQSGTGGRDRAGPDRGPRGATRRRGRRPGRFHRARAEGANATVAVADRTLKLSNLDKVLYPGAGFTKREVIDYYASIAPVLLPHLADRPLTVDALARRCRRPSRSFRSRRPRTAPTGCRP